ncbi:MAG: glycoside hydrolase family 16 protein [Cytophagales bacterium]|nr:MAG: glycoside hydrolase family 16 protein [Cytophagales bacterium]
MKMKNTILALSLSALYIFSCKQSQVQPDTSSNKPTEFRPLEKTLVWSDEFDYTGLPDAKKWNYDVGGEGWGNQERQFYTKERTKNARVENGKLIIEAHKEDFSGSKYTSARLVTKGKGDWTYGTIEVRAKLPKGVGTWPAIWMLASTENLKWPDDGEIDIMEHVGYDPNVIHGTVHTKAYNHSIGTQKGSQINIDDAQEAFHTYRIEWDGKVIDWYVDDKKYFSFFNTNGGTKDTYPFTYNFHLLLNIAIGGSWGGQKGIDDTIFPQRMEIEYVRVYQMR